jgi:hypothetical protein
MTDEIEPRKPFELITRRGKHCAHRRTVVCEEERVVECGDCKAILDPIDVLVMMSRHRDRLMFENRHTRTEIERAKEELAALKKDIRNTKARIRRNTPKDPEAVAARELVPGAKILRIERTSGKP